MHHATTTYDSGFFTDSLAGLPDGLYLWRVKGPKDLANAGSVNLTGAPTINVDMGLMLTGDCNDDNYLNIRDFTILKSTYGKAMGDPGYDDRADFTGDQAVNGQDFSLLRSNFGFSGAAPITPRSP